MRHRVLACILALWALVGPSQRRAAPEASRGPGGIITAPDDTRAGKQWLLVIGIDKYPEGTNWPPLACAVRDAKAVCDVLQRRYCFDDVFQLYDGEATHDAILSRLRFLAKNAAEGDSVLIYYAGHGHLDKDVEKIGFWIPCDGAASDTRWIGNDRIKRLIAGMGKALHVLLISDSCFAGDFFRRHRGGTEEIRDPYYKRTYSRASRQALVSGGLEEVADASVGGHSPFAFCLLNALKKNRQPYIGPTKLYDLIHDGVVSNSKQLPRCDYLQDAGHMGGEYVFFLRSTQRKPQRSQLPPR